MVFVISYLFATSLFWPESFWWELVIALPLLVPAVWIAWLILLYLHSLIVKLCWAIGLCTDLPRNRIQSVLMGIVRLYLRRSLLPADHACDGRTDLDCRSRMQFNCGSVLALFDEESR